MALNVGDKAPDFELTTKSAEGPKKIKLSGNLGKKNTVLLFFPMAFTGVCTKEMCEASQGLNSYTGLNAEVWGVSGDNPFAQAAWAEKEKITATRAEVQPQPAAVHAGFVTETCRRNQLDPCRIVQRQRA